MQRNTLKFILDAILFVSLTSTAVVGLLLAFVIPGGGNIPHQEKFFLGLHRHTWGDIHLTFALIFLGVLAVHIYLNWSWIVGNTQKYFGERWKQFLWALCGAWFVVLIIAGIVAK
ncbi:MAG: DUF4405 domain-containing protein [Thermodesulforhabdaceae bacterium]